MRCTLHRDLAGHDDMTGSSASEQPPASAETGAGMRVKVQATCVAMDGVGVLLQGPPGSGKSDLALQLIDRGARLVADDLTELRRDGGVLMARIPEHAPAAARGRLEVRGIGLLPVPTVPSVALGLAVELKPQGEIERLPEARRWRCLGLELPLIALDPRTASAAAKLRLVVGGLPGIIMPPP